MQNAAFKNLLSQNFSSLFYVFGIAEFDTAIARGYHPKQETQDVSWKSGDDKYNFHAVGLQPSCILRPW
jgi:hypothetical protein